MSAPNLLVVIADQFRASAIGCLGQDPVHTPALDRLVAEGRLLTEATSTYPVCSPARAMLLTGRYPWSNGVPDNVNSATAPRGVGLDAATPCWSDVLAEAGYALGYIGKWHLTAPSDADEVHGEGRREDGRVWDAWTPPAERHGFDFWYAHGCCDRHLRPHYWTSRAGRAERVDVDQWSAEHEVDVAIDFLRSVSGDGARRPFGLVVSLNPPHQPFDELPDGALERYADVPGRDLLVRPNVDPDGTVGRSAAAVAPQYFAAVTAVDAQVGRLLDALDELGRTGDTVVVFTSDHGMQLGSHELMYKNVWFEESFRVPFVVRWPGHVPVGRDATLLSSVDVAPTLLGLLGMADRVPAGVEGTDCSPLLLGADQEVAPTAALYLGPARDDEGPDVRGIRTASHKLVVERRGEGAMRRRLYDLQKDPFELRDVLSEQPTVAEALGRDLRERLGRIGDPWSVGPADRGPA